MSEYEVVSQLLRMIHRNGLSRFKVFWLRFLPSRAVASVAYQEEKKRKLSSHSWLRCGKVMLYRPEYLVLKYTLSTQVRVKLSDVTLNTVMSWKIYFAPKQNTEMTRK